MAALWWMVTLPLDRDPDKQSEWEPDSQLSSALPGGILQRLSGTAWKGAPNGDTADIRLSSNSRRSMNLAPSSSLFGLLLKAQHRESQQALQHNMLVALAKGSSAGCLSAVLSHSQQGRRQEERGLFAKMWNRPNHIPGLCANWILLLTSV